MGCKQSSDADAKTNGNAQPSAPVKQLEPLPSVPQNDNAVTKGPIYIARYSYEARTDEDLSFRKGEKLEVIGDTEGDWWQARALATSKEGYIPRNYVAPIASYEAEE